MKYSLLTLAGGLLCAGAAFAAPICPTTSNNATGADSTGCGVLLTYTTPTGAPSVTITGTGPYDASEDTTVGVINHTSAALSSITLTSTMFAFGFDGDGIEAFISTNGVPIGTGGATGYEGPNTTFDQTGVVGGNGTLVVNFTKPIAVGGSDYFSLEGPPSANIVGSAPEPASIAMLGTGMLALGGLTLRRRRKQ